MVIHDMRSPTVSIKNGIELVVQNLTQMDRLQVSLKEFESLQKLYTTKLQAAEEEESTRRAQSLAVCEEIQSQGEETVAALDKIHQQMTNLRMSLQS